MDDSDIYLMVKYLTVYANILILKRKFYLTFLLVLFSIGSYTYSEITTTPYQAKKSENTSLVFSKLINHDFSIYYLSPTSYIKKCKEKAMALKIPSEKIMDKGKIVPSTLADFLRSSNNDIDYTYAQTLAGLYFEEAGYEGVNLDIAFTQMCLETGFLRFDGTVDKHQNNFCGLGATGNGVKGLSFTDPRQGVRAHIQHLKAYASTQDLNKELVDTRFKFVKRGSVTHLNGLTGKWATDSMYDKKIRSLLDRLYRFSR